MPAARPATASRWGPARRVPRTPRLPRTPPAPRIPPVIRTPGALRARLGPRAPRELRDLCQHELQVFEQALQPCICGGGRIEHQAGGHQEVAGLRRELDVRLFHSGLRPKPGEQRLRAGEILSRRDAIRECALVAYARRRDRSRAQTRWTRRPAPDPDAEGEHGGDADAPAEPGARAERSPPPARLAHRYDAAPQLLARRLWRTMIVLRGIPQQPLDPV